MNLCAECIPADPQNTSINLRQSIMISVYRNVLVPAVHKYVLYVHKCVHDDNIYYIYPLICSLFFFLFLFI